jgi:uracil-DNA glycosylase
MIVKNLILNIQTNWKDVLQHIMNGKEYSHSIDSQIDVDIIKYQGDLNVYPPQHLVFNAFNWFDVEDLKVVILGQDPYINEGEAMGLAFSVPEGFKCPPSLRNVFKELERQYGVVRRNTDLTDWAQQGVLLLNTALTVLQGKSGHHMKIWKDFTIEVLAWILINKTDVVFMLWGNWAQDVFSLATERAGNIRTSQRFLVLRHTHPSPLSRKPFVGCGHFGLCDEFLQERSIKWV